MYLLWHVIDFDSDMYTLVSSTENTLSDEFVHADYKSLYIDILMSM